ncbi:MAG: hypothetical protein V4449_03300 [Patescibacteria group bacterium]
MGESDSWYKEHHDRNHPFITIADKIRGIYFIRWVFISRSKDKFELAREWAKEQHKLLLKAQHRRKQKKKPDMWKHRNPENIVGVKTKTRVRTVVEQAPSAYINAE